MDEWYKAAYYDPSMSSYRECASSGGGIPDAVASGTDGNEAVYSQNFAQGLADITQAGGLNAYVIMGMSGNVWEWEEASQDLDNSSSSSNRGIRGGNWNNNSNNLSSSNRNDNNPANENNNNGFRVASSGTVCGGSRLFGPESLGSSKRIQRPCPYRDYPILRRAGGLAGGRITWCAVVVSSLGERRYRTAFGKVAWASKQRLRVNQKSGAGLSARQSTPGGIRTCDLRVRNALLYPAELRGRCSGSLSCLPAL
jgi:hypothetical protein